jgi:arabinogalactan oligomer/maltooligosaccharide transport system permease protein
VLGLLSGEDATALFLRQVANSLLVSLTTAAAAILVATPTAYALARFPFVGSKMGLRALLATQMFPTVASAVPLYLLLDVLHLLDSRTGLVLVYASTAVPFAIFQLRGAFLSIPVDIEEAAMVDGASRLRAFLLVVLPAARPAIAVTALFAFMSAWNEFILAATLLSRKSAYTLPVVIQSYVQEQSTSWGPFAAGAILVSVPVMALFYVAQRQLVSGLTQGGVKG